MARKPITREDINPSYDDIINELSGLFARLAVENSILKVTNKKLEGLVKDLIENPDNQPE